MKKLSVRSQYYLGVAVILLICSVGASWYQYQNLRNQALTSIYKKTEIYLATAASIRSYVKETLRPKVSELVSEDEFILEAMSTSFVSRQIMNNIKKSFPEFEYKRTALNPRNPINKADKFEEKMLLWFGANKDKAQWSGMISKHGRTYYSRMMPIKVEPECLACHGSPEQAPRELQKLYGTERSFGYKVGAIAAADTIYIPVDALLLGIKEKTSWVFIFGILSLFSLFAVFVLLFNRTAVHQLKRLLDTLKSIYASDIRHDELTSSGAGDEIEQIRSAFKSVAADLKNVHEKLKSSESKFRSIFHLSPNAIFVSDEEGQITDLNNAGTRIFEIKNLPDFLNNNLFANLFQNPDIGEKIISGVLENGSVNNFESVLITQSGNEIDVSISATLIVDEAHQFKFIEGIIRDITEEKRINQHLAQTERLASIGQLAAGVAHEINNPLGVILCYGDLIDKNVESSAQINEDISIVLKHANECKTIVESLLNFGRASDTHFEKADIHHVITEVLAVLSNQLKKQNIHLKQRFNPDIEKVLLDEQKIKQVFMNLLLNSLQAMPDGGELTVSTDYNSDHESVSITISDTGCGISQEKLGKIFEPFFTTKEQGKGTGLGLSVSYGIIQQHKGQLTVESRENKGTSFSITLPQNSINLMEQMA
jgi:two-component system, NtrC family, sensor kinase